MKHRQCHCRSGQRGQALVEGAVVVLVMIVLWVCATWLFRLQDMSLQSRHAGRFAAFSYARGFEDNPVQDSTRQQFFSATSHQWRTLRGDRWLSGGLAEVTVERSFQPLADVSGQPGAGDVQTSQLLSGWIPVSHGLTVASVEVRPRTLPVGVSPVMTHRQSILVGAAYGVSDIDVLHRLERSGPGWANAASASMGSARLLDAVLQPLDAGWSRPEIRFDWLDPWIGAVPEKHLHHRFTGGMK